MVKYQLLKFLSFKSSELIFGRKFTKTLSWIFAQFLIKSRISLKFKTSKRKTFILESHINWLLLVQTFFFLLLIDGKFLSLLCYFTIRTLLMERHRTNFGSMFNWNGVIMMLMTLIDTQEQNTLTTRQTITLWAFIHPLQESLLASTLPTICTQLMGTFSQSSSPFFKPQCHKSWNITQLYMSSEKESVKVSSSIVQSQPNHTWTQTITKSCSTTRSSGLSTIQMHIESQCTEPKKETSPQNPSMGQSGSSTQEQVSFTLKSSTRVLGRAKNDSVSSQNGKQQKRSQPL